MGTPSAYIFIKSKQRDQWNAVNSADLFGCLIHTDLSVVGGQSSGDEEEMYDAK